jgi:hypothetical protein
MDSRLALRWLINISQIYRVKDWFYFIGFVLIIIASTNMPIIFSKVVLGCIFLISYLAWGYSFNNIFDIEEDQKIASKNFFSRSKNRMWLYVSIPFVVMVILAILFNLEKHIFFITVLNLLYSHPITRLKKIIPTSVLINSIIFSMSYYLTSLIVNGGAHPSFDLSMLVFLIFIPIQYIHILEHVSVFKKKSPIDIATLMSLFILIILFLLLSESLILSSLLTITSIYAVIFIGLFIYISKTQRLRVKVRYLSIAYGFCLCLSVWALNI